MQAVLRQAAVTVISRTGSMVTLRPCTTADAPLIVGMYGQLSAETIRMRYCSAGIRVSGEREAERICGADPDLHIIYLALCNGQAIGIGELFRCDSDPSLAELALLVRDDRQREGIGTALCHQLVEAGRDAGVAKVQVYVLTENAAMLRLIRKLPFARTSDYYGGEVQITLHLRVPVAAG